MAKKKKTLTSAPGPSEIAALSKPVQKKPTLSSAPSPSELQSKFGAQTRKVPKTLTSAPGPSELQSLFGPQTMSPNFGAINLGKRPLGPITTPPPPKINLNKNPGASTSAGSTGKGGKTGDGSTVDTTNFWEGYDIWRDNEKGPDGDGNDGNGNDGNGNDGNSSEGIGGDTKVDKDTDDAFALLEATFRMYDLEELVPAIKQMMIDGVGAARASLMLKTDPKYNVDAAGNPMGYQKRFFGNELRRKAGLNVLSENEYLELENSYSKTLRAYGQQNYFGTDRKKRQEAMSNIIGNDISADEFQGRVSLVVDKVENSDPYIRQTLRTFYNITDNDLVGYFLNPKQTLPLLQQKVSTAEIGSAALMQGLAASLGTAEGLAKFGVSRAKAVEGYGIIADILPAASMAGEIFKEEGISYTQDVAEEEVFKELASARRKRVKLGQKQAGLFAGSGGTLGSRTLGTGVAGAI